MGKLSVCVPLLGACVVEAQPVVGIVEIFGARKTAVEKIRSASGARAGAQLPKSRVEAEENIEAISGIVRARVEAVCCESGRAILYVGVQERGSPAPEFRPEPEEDLTLPAPVADAYRDYSAALEQAGREGDLAESLAAGHALAGNAGVRAEQDRLLALAEIHGDEMRAVLRDSRYADQRAMAAFALQYRQDKRAAEEDLQKALQDPDETVRRNAARSLQAFAVLARQAPASGVKVSGAWLVELLNSLAWSDRVEAARALLVLTETSNPNLTASIKERALASLLETAAWQHLSHALPAFLLLGRVAGWSDEQTQSAWTAGERAKAMEQMRKSLRPR